MIVAVALPGLLLGSLAEEIRDDLGISASVIGVAVAALWLAAALGSAPAGRFVDRFGPTRGMHVAWSGGCAPDSRSSPPPRSSPAIRLFRD